MYIVQWTGEIDENDKMYLAATLDGCRHIFLELYFKYKIDESLRHSSKELTNEKINDFFIRKFNNADGIKHHAYHYFYCDNLKITEVDYVTELQLKKNFELISTEYMIKDVII